ncbi:hypothetical protein QYE76_037919 [Lolium multiflorum]|uniref:DUF8039 domain-containing protein n=1 Tax=Lolium multiflorum TaxID=4521 RepID=A0AAD8WSF3_LOLMU|nr:hypothetical protein QYE76_037919 [Lolium multiflorum]
MSMKVAIGSALPGALHHNNPIQDGYARVTVEEIVQGFEDLDIDIATPEGVKRLGDVKRQFILWQKKFIKFQARRQQVHPRTVVVVAVAVAVAAVAAVAVTVAVVLHLIHLIHGRRRPRPRPGDRHGTAPNPPPAKKRPGLLTRTLTYLRKQRQALAFKRKELAEKKALKDEAESKLERGKEVAQLGNKLFNLRDLDKSIICYVLMKKREMRIRNIHDVGFIDPHIVNSYVLEHHPADVEDDLWRFIRKQQQKSDILFPYHFGFHWILMVIKVQTSSVLVHDSRIWIRRFGAT